MVKASAFYSDGQWFQSWTLFKKFFFKLKRKISLHDERPHVITQRNDIFYMMKGSQLPDPLHCSRKERLTQKSTAYKVPAAEAAGQKRSQQSNLMTQNFPPVYLMTPN